MAHEYERLRDAAVARAAQKRQEERQHDERRRQDLVGMLEREKADEVGRRERGISRTPTS